MVTIRLLQRTIPQVEQRRHLHYFLVGIAKAVLPVNKSCHCLDSTRQWGWGAFSNRNLQ